MDRTKLLLLVALLVVAAWYLSTVGLVSATVSASVSPSSASPGDTVTVTGSVSNVSWSSPGYYCVDFSQTETASWCNSSSGKCYVPCQDDTVSGLSGVGYQVYRCTDNSGSLGCTLALYSGAKPSISTYTDPTRVGAVDYLLANSSSPTSYSGFLTPDNLQLRVDFGVSSASPFTNVKPTVAICYTGGITVTGPSDWTYYTTVSGYWYGRTWTCKVYTRTDYIFSDTSYFIVTGSAGDRFYVSFATQCYYDTAQCPSSVYSADVWVSGVYPTGSQLGSSVLFDIDEGSALSCSGTSGLSSSSSGSTATYSTTCTVQSVAPGSYSVTVDAYDYGVFFYHYWYDGTIPIVLGAGYYYGSDTATLTVATKATDVYLYDYGSDTGVPEQEPDDHYVEFRVKVTGGTLFDSVKIYIDGSLKATYTPSEMTCTSTYCYKDARISMQGAPDGSHTIKAELYVDGTLKDSDQKTFNYYQVGVRNVTASQVGTTNQFSVSWEVKGGWKDYRVYVDTTSCIARDWTADPPADAHDYQTYGPITLSIPSCAATSGTHTVYVDVRDESGLVATSSTSVSWTITHTYSVDLTSPTTGVKHVQTDREGLPPSTYTETMSATYNTDDPSASLVFKVNGSTVQSWTVSGSGTKSYTVSADDLSCGQVTFRAELGPASDPSSGVTDESSVTYYCWYIDIGSPENGSTITFPSEDLSTIAPGSTLDVYISDSVTPSDRVYAVYATLDGSSGSPLSCPAGYDHCFRFDVGGMSCGSSHTIQAWIDEAGDTRATATSTVTFQCSQNFVRIDSPSDGQELDYYVPLGDVNVVLAITYAGGDSLQIILNGQEVSPPETNDCSSTVCYVLTTAEGLRLGPNEVNVILYSGGSPVTQDSVTFSVYTWLYVPGEVWDQTPPLLVLRENGSQADSCRLITEENTLYMSYDPDNSWWYYPIDDSWKGRDVNFECSFHSRVVWTGSYTVQGTTVQPAAPTGPTGFVSVPIAKSPFPVFPDKAQVSHYIYSVYHFAGRSPTDVFKDVYISQDRLCFVPKEGKHTITYYAYNFQTWPTGDNEVKQILGSLSPRDQRDVEVQPSGNAYCIPLSGTAVIRDTVTGAVTGEYYFLVLDTAQAAAPINAAFLVVIILVAALLAWMLWGGRLG